MASSSSAMGLVLDKEAAENLITVGTKNALQKANELLKTDLADARDAFLYTLTKVEKEKEDLERELSGEKFYVTELEESIDELVEGEEQAKATAKDSELEIVRLSLQLDGANKMIKSLKEHLGLG